MTDQARGELVPGGLAMPSQLMPIKPEADPLSIDQRQEREV